MIWYRKRGIREREKLEVDGIGFKCYFAGLFGATKIKSKKWIAPCETLGFYSEKMVVTEREIETVTPPLGES